MKLNDTHGVAASPVPSTEGHSAILQLAGDRCPCERCEADRRAAGVQEVPRG
jgi:hypothetical protein